MNGRRLLVLATLLLTMGCVAPGGVGKATPTNPITGAEIATTSLDNPANPPAVSMPKPKPRPQKSKSGLGKPEIVKSDPVKPDPVKPEPGKAEPGKADPSKTGTPTSEPAKPVPPPLTAEGRACLKKGGLWGKAGIGLGNTCVMRTRDSGKSCHRASQCDGVCLARSQTCAPYKPLFGCNAILQDNGLEVTLCID